MWEFRVILNSSLIVLFTEDLNVFARYRVSAVRLKDGTCTEDTGVVMAPDFNNTSEHSNYSGCGIRTANISLNKLGRTGSSLRRHTNVSSKSLADEDRGIHTISNGSNGNLVPSSYGNMIIANGFVEHIQLDDTLIEKGLNWSMPENTSQREQTKISLSQWDCQESVENPLPTTSAIVLDRIATCDSGCYDDRCGEDNESATSSQEDELPRIVQPDIKQQENLRASVKSDSYDPLYLVSPAWHEWRKSANIKASPLTSIKARQMLDPIEPTLKTKAKQLLKQSN